MIEEPTFEAAEMDSQQQQSQPPSRDERDARQPQPQPDAVRLQRECEELLERVQAMEPFCT